jgi:sulfane dehydrogenase subunit SoxC
MSGLYSRAPEALQGTVDMEATRPFASSPDTPAFEPLDFDPLNPPTVQPLPSVSPTPEPMLSAPVNTRDGGEATDQSPPDSPDRRRFLRRSALAAGAAVAGTAAVGTGLAAAGLPIPRSNQSLGRAIPATDYGMPIKFENHVTRNRTDVFVNRQNWSDWSMTPLQHQIGTLTPNGLIFERHHAGIPEIDPDEHRLVIHGLVDRPLVFTMDQLMRFPSVTRYNFMECSGNTLTDWGKAQSTTVQQSHGLLSCCQWTGIPFSTVLAEAGVKPEARWVVLEGADGSGHLRSIPMEKIMDDALLVFGQNGERLRAEQGYPLRAFLPGWEGNVSVKWLRRIHLVDAPIHARSETARYTDPMPEGRWRQFSFEMECKSVVTRPSGGMTLNGAGYYQIQGFAWSGEGHIDHVDVTLDGGRTWHEAKLDTPVLDRCLTRFTLDWHWDGRPAMIASRAVDSTGYVQPTARAIAEQRAIVGFVQHHNGVFPWRVNEHGEVSNAIA